MKRMTKKARGIVNRLCGFCYMDYDSPGKEAEPNKETKEAINEARQKKGYKAENVEDLFEQLNS